METRSNCHALISRLVTPHFTYGGDFAVGTFEAVSPNECRVSVAGRSCPFCHKSSAANTTCVFFQVINKRGVLEAFLRCKTKANFFAITLCKEDLRDLDHDPDFKKWHESSSGYPIIFSDDLSLNNLAHQALDNTVADIAKLFCHIAHPTWRYSVDGQDKKWFEFSHHRWQHRIEGAGPYFQVSMCRIFSHMEKYYEVAMSPEAARQLKIKGRKDASEAAKIAKVLQQIKNRPLEFFPNQSASFFLEKTRNFLQTLDSNKNLVGFNNGVYDLKENCFREGRPEDNISMSTGYDYGPSSPEAEEHVMKVLRDTFQDDHDLDWLLRLGAYQLRGGNPAEIFVIFEGSGRNGKGVVSNLLVKTLGDYAGEINTAMLTEKRQNSDGKPRPELLNNKRKRALFASELEMKQRLNCAFIKDKLSGGGNINERTCYSRTIESFVLGVATLSLNPRDHPYQVFDGIDEALLKRLRVLKFRTEFVEDEPRTSHQRPRNQNLKKKIENDVEWRRAMMNILITYHQKYGPDDTLSPTPNMQEASVFYANGLKSCVRLCDSG
ncbi:TPA_asm: S3H [Synchytrium chytrid fungus MELD element]|nr:TPA_asm: S3H [Synchytrium chytrid fungus MELD element]